MDSGRGHLEPIPRDIFEKAQKVKRGAGLFRVGEVVEVKGGLFEVKSIILRDRLSMFPWRINLKPIENTPENQAKVLEYE